MIKADRDRVYIIRKDRPFAVAAFAACLMLSFFIMYAFGHMGWVSRLLSYALFLVVLLSVPRRIPGDVVFDKATQSVEMKLWGRGGRVPFVDIAAIRPAAYGRDTGEPRDDDRQKAVSSKGLAYCLFTKRDPYFDCIPVTGFIKDTGPLDDLRRECFRGKENRGDETEDATGLSNRVFEQGGGSRDMLSRTITPAGYYLMAVLTIPLAMTFGAMLLMYMKGCPRGWSSIRSAGALRLCGGCLERAPGYFRSAMSRKSSSISESRFCSTVLTLHCA